MNRYYHTRLDVFHMNNGLNPGCFFISVGVLKLKFEPKMTQLNK